MSIRSPWLGLAIACGVSVFTSPGVVRAQTPSVPNADAVTVASPAPVPANETEALSASPAPGNTAASASPAPGNMAADSPTPEPVTVPNPESNASKVTKPTVVPVPLESNVGQKVQEPLYDWSLGAGLGWMTYSTGLVSSSNTASPIGSMGMTVGTGATAITYLERRLTKGTFLLVQPEILYVRGTGPINERTSYVHAFTLSAGIRWVLNPDAPVEVGMAHAFQVNSISAGDETDGIGSTSKSSGLGISTALVVERKLLSQLWLRVAANWLSANLAKTTQHTETSEGGNSDVAMHSLTVRFTISPSLSLRLEF